MTIQGRTFIRIRALVCFGDHLYIGIWLIYTMPKKMQQFRIQESCCILMALQPTFPSCNMHIYVALIALAAVFSTLCITWYKTGVQYQLSWYNMEYLNRHFYILGIRSCLKACLYTKKVSHEIFVGIPLELGGSNGT